MKYVCMHCGKVLVDDTYGKPLQAVFICCEECKQRRLLEYGKSKTNDTPVVDTNKKQRLLI